MENHKNRFAHIVPGGCMFKLESSLESGVERVQDSDTDDNTDKEDDTTDEEYEEYDKHNSNQATLSTYSYCVDIIKSSQHKKDKYINCGKKWTIEDNKKLINMYLQETDIDLMITNFGRTKYALQCQLRRIIYDDYLTCKDKIHIQQKYKITIEKLDEIIEKYN
jgi:hypothetical protein